MKCPESFAFSEQESAVHCFKTAEHTWLHAARVKALRLGTTEEVEIHVTWTTDARPDYSLTKKKFEKTS